MLARLLRRDAVAIVAPAFWVGLAMIGAMYAVVANGYAAEGRAPALGSTTETAIWTLAILLWANLSIFGWRIFDKATPLQMALPVPARLLWLSRVSAMVLAFSGGLIAAGATFALVYEHPVEPLRRAVGFNLVALATLLPILYLSGRVRWARWGMPLPLYGLLNLAIAWGAAAMGMDTARPGLAAFAAGVVIGAVTWYRTPPAFELWTRGASGGSIGVGAIGDRLAGLPLIGELVQRDRLLRAPRWLTLDQALWLLGLGMAASVLTLTRSPLGAVLGVVLVQVAWFARVLNGAARTAYLPLRPVLSFLHAVVPGFAAPVVLLATIVLFTETAPFGVLAGSPIVALAAACYLLAWWLAHSAFLFRLAVPGAGRIASLARDPRLWIGVSLAAIWLGAKVTELRQQLPTGALFARMAESIPGGAPVVWLIAALLLLASAVDLYRGFRRAELVTLIKGIPS